MEILVSRRAIVWSLSLLAIAGRLAAQEEDARRHLDEAGRLVAEGDSVAAARALRTADCHAGAIADEVVRAELRAEIAAQAEDADPLFEKRREIEREHAGRFLEIASRLLAAGLPRTAKLAVEDAGELDPIMAADVQTEVEAGIAAQVKGSPEAQADTAAALLLAMTAEFDDVLERARKLNKDLPEWLETRAAATEALRKLALDYRRKKRLELSYEVARMGFRMYRIGIREEFAAIQEAVLTARAERRYEELAKPAMDDFRRGNKKLGRSRRWRFDGMTIEAPPASQQPAIIVSKRTLTGSYRIEADLQLVEMLGVFQLVVAWRDADDYCVLEFERPRASYSWIRAVHVRDGTSRTLAEAQAAQTLDDYFRVSADVADGRVEVALGSASCRAELPLDTSAGVSFGLIRPALTREPTKRDERSIIRIRNLVVIER